MVFMFTFLINFVIISLFLFLLVAAIETEKPFWVVTFILYISALIPFIDIIENVNNDNNNNNKRPCMKYETEYVYNSEVKAMMPARVCVEYGEWIKEE